MHGLADVVEHPPTLTDIGMKAAGQAFPNMRSLTVYNCPLLQNPHSWRTPGKREERLTMENMGHFRRTFWASGLAWTLM